MMCVRAILYIIYNKFSNKLTPITPPHNNVFFHVRSLLPIITACREALDELLREAVELESEFD